MVTVKDIKRLPAKERSKFLKWANKLVRRIDRENTLRQQDKS
jgi:hypothetical protein